MEGEGVFWERSGFNPSEVYSFRVYGYNAGVAGKVDGDISAKVVAEPGFQGRKLGLTYYSYGFCFDCFKF